MKTSQRYQLPAENLTISLHEKTPETMEKPKKPHWHPQLPTTQPKNLGILTKSKMFT
jgi:hypothetical protein